MFCSSGMAPDSQLSDTNSFCFTIGSLHNAHSPKKHQQHHTAHLQLYSVGAQLGSVQHKGSRRGSNTDVLHMPCLQHVLYCSTTKPSRLAGGARVHTELWLTHTAHIHAQTAQRCQQWPALAVSQDLQAQQHLTSRACAQELQHLLCSSSEL